MAFLNWVPSYYRSNPRRGHREVVCELEEADAIATWILVTKLLRCHGESQSRLPDHGAAGVVAAGLDTTAMARERSMGEGRGSLRVRCGTENAASDAGTRILLSGQEVGQLQAFLDHRRNPRLHRQEQEEEPVVPFQGVSSV